MMPRFSSLLSRSVDGASLGVFRIALGCCVTLEAALFLWPRPGGNYLEARFAGTSAATVVARILESVPVPR